jgi:hypothetical protein
MGTEVSEEKIASIFNVQETLTRRNDLEDHSMNLRRDENLKSYIRTQFAGCCSINSKINGNNCGGTYEFRECTKKCHILLCTKAIQQNCAHKGNGKPQTATSTNGQN